MKIERREPTNLFRKQKRRRFREYIPMRTTAKYAALTLVGILLFRAGQIHALAERGYLQATLDVLRDESSSVLQAVKDLNAAYEKAEAAGFQDFRKEAQEFERLLWAVPERMWVE